MYPYRHHPYWSVWVHLKVCCQGLDLGSDNEYIDIYLKSVDTSKIIFNFYSLITQSFKQDQA